jgi:hypothetical protein
MKYQLSTINHKKRKEESKGERDHQPEEVAVELRSFGREKEIS